MSEVVYTKSQVGVMVITIAVINGVMLGHGFAFIHGFASPYWMWIMLFCSLLPLYFRQVRIAFLAGAYGFGSMFAWAVIYPSLLDVVRWYMLTWPVYHIYYYVAYSSAVVGIYFAYKSYRELET